MARAQHIVQVHIGGVGSDFGEAVGVADGEGEQVMFGGDAGYLGTADVPVVVVVGDFDAVHVVLNDDVGRVIAGVAVVAEQAAAGQVEFHAVVFVKGAAGGAHIDFPAGDDEDAVGEVFRRDAVQGQAPVLPPVVGDGNAVQPGGFNLGRLRLRRFRGWAAGNRTFRRRGYGDPGVQWWQS